MRFLIRVFGDCKLARREKQRGLKQGEKMPGSWFNLKRSIKCKPDLFDVEEPKSSSIYETRKSHLYSRTLSHSRDIFHGSKRPTEKAPIDSPGYSLMEPVYSGRGRSLSPSRKIGGSGISSNARRPLDAMCQGFLCRICEKFIKSESIEEHHLSTHAVTALSEGDPSKRIVELICRTNLWEPEHGIGVGQIERVLKVNNMQSSIAQFEDYREMVKIKADKLSNKQARCLADGNELLRFYGTSVECNIGSELEDGSSLCTSYRCRLCRFLRYGFSSKKESLSSWGVLTCSSSKNALECIKLGQGTPLPRQALVVCRVIAGRVHKPSENQKQVGYKTSLFDSVAGKVDCHSNIIEQLYSLNPTAILPCFVLICNP